MLNVKRLNELSKKQKVTVEQIAEHLVRGGFDRDDALRAVKNWKRSLFKPAPSIKDIKQIATALSATETELKEWKSSCRYAPSACRKTKLVTQLIVGRNVQDALDVLKFTEKRAATIINKVLKAAIADADEQNADIDKLFVTRAYVDDAGIRIATKRFRAKDRGKAYRILQKASHIHVCIAEA